MRDAAPRPTFTSSIVQGGKNCRPEGKPVGPNVATFARAKAGIVRSATMSGQKGRIGQFY